MTSIASSIQPRPPAMRVFRSAAVTSFGRENRAARICVALELGDVAEVLSCTMRSGLYRTKRKEGGFFLLACRVGSISFRLPACVDFVRLPRIRRVEDSMAFCKACGQEIGTATFCPKCGASQASTAGSAPVAVTASPTEGLQENVAGLLCYVLGWL